MSKWLVIIGIVFVIAGLLWPVITRLGIGHLPGDIHVKSDDMDFYFPLTTSILISLGASLLLWLLRK